VKPFLLTAAMRIVSGFIATEWWNLHGLGKKAKGIELEHVEAKYCKKLFMAKNLLLLMQGVMP
jgi:hypothetical protein